MEYYIIIGWLWVFILALYEYFKYGVNDDTNPNYTILILIVLFWPWSVPLYIYENYRKN